MTCLQDSIYASSAQEDNASDVSARPALCTENQSISFLRDHQPILHECTKFGVSWYIASWRRAAHALDSHFSAWTFV